MTKEGKFRVDKSTEVIVPMMRQKKKLEWAKIDDLSSTMLELPFKGGLVMQFLLPNDEDGVSAVEAQLKDVNINSLFTNKSRTLQVMVKIPKFKLTNKMHLKNYFEHLGMKDLFSDKADLTKMTAETGISVSQITHEATIEINEEGSEAAAATKAKFGFRSAPRKPRKFFADHPFLIFLRHKRSGMLLFQAKVINPIK